MGGGLIGIGMATTGARPGTILVQIATGVRSGTYVGLGGITGGILCARFGGLLRAQGRNNTPSPSSSEPESKRQHTIDAQFNLKPTTVLLVYEILCLSMITGTIFSNGLDPRSPHLHPKLVVSWLVSRKQPAFCSWEAPLGSPLHMEAGAYFRWIFSSHKEKGTAPRPKVSALTFAVGILAGRV